MNNTKAVSEAKYRGNYRIWLRFTDGESAQFHLDSWPTLAWDCGFDVSPESLYERVVGKPALREPSPSV
jgi:hypothetical protein